MSGEGYLDDRGLIARLGVIAQAADGPPDAAYELGRAAFAWRLVDSELAQLVADSALEAAAVRGAAPGERLLSFETDDVKIEIQVTVRRGRRSLLGQVMPQPSATVGVAQVETDTGVTRSATLDAVGRFEIDDVAGARLRFRIAAPGSPAVTTVWVSL